MFFLLLAITINSKELYLNPLNFIDVETDEKIFMTSDNGGLFSFDPADSSWIIVNTEDGLYTNSPGDIFFRNDSLMVTTTGGLNLFDTELEPLESQRFSLAFSDTSVKCVCIDRGKVILGGENGVQWFSLSEFGELGQVANSENYGMTVYDILCDSSLYYLATERGVYRVDTTLLDTFSIYTAVNTEVIEKIDGDIWAGGEWGCGNISKDTAFFFTHPVNDIKKIEEKIYISTNGGLYRYDNNWVRLSQGIIKGVAQLHAEDSIIIIEHGKGLKYKGDDSYIRPPGPASNKITDITQTPDGLIFMSHRDSRTISVFDGNRWSFLNESNQWGLPSNYISGIESDSRGNIYIGVWYWNPVPVVFRYNPGADTIAEPLSLPVDVSTVTCLMVDSYDNLWIGAYRTGSDRSWIIKGSESDDSLSWKVYNSSFIEFPRVIAEGDDGIYCGNSHPAQSVGINYISQTGNIIQVGGNPEGGCLAMEESRDGGVWVGLENKLAYISDQEIIEEYNVGNSGILSNKVDGLAVDFQGGLWTYHSNEGISYRNPDGEWVTGLNQLRDIAYTGGDDVTYPLYLTREHDLLAGTYRGLYRIELDFKVSKDIERVNVYPNPFNSRKHNFLNFSSDSLGGKEILIYDLRGKLMAEHEVEEGNDYLSIDIDLQSGLYVYAIIKNGEVLARGKFAVIR